jgi:hypothetical protein
VNETVEAGGDDEDEWSLRGLQRALDAGGVEQAEGGVQGFAEASRSSALTSSGRLVERSMSRATMVR